MISTPITREFVHGALALEQTAAGWLPHRLPAAARAQCGDAQLAMAEAQPAGVRLVFRTSARLLELVVLPTRRAYAGMPPRPAGVYDLFVDGRLVCQRSAQGGNTLHIDMATASASLVAGDPQALRFDELPAGAKHIEIWLPHDESVELVALRTDAPILPRDAPARPAWVHHGSSISQGSNATHPSGTWPAVAAVQAGVDLVNLGFGGSALLDPFVARAIRSLPADIISVKIGINLVNTDLMRLRAFGPAVHGFLDTIRDGHPATPVVVVSPVFCPIHEHTPGPTRFDMDALADGRLRFRAAGNPAETAEGKLTLGIIRQQLASIVRQRAGDDPHLHYMDGLALYGPDDHARLPLPDALHPDTATHRLIGERFAAVLATIVGGKAPPLDDLGKPSAAATSGTTAPVRW
jgi:hypothetical protein